MLAKQMHIQFELGLQKLGSLSRRKLYPQQIDAFLNKAVDQFVLDSIKVEEDSHGFEKQIIDTDRIRDLIVDHSSIVAQFQRENNNFKEYLLDLPDNYAHFISAEWYQAEDCSSTVTTSTVNRYLYRVPLKDSPLSAAPFYAIVKLEMNSGMTTDTLISFPADLAQSSLTTNPYTGYDSKLEKFTVANLIREVYSQKVLNGVLSFSTGDSIYGIFYERFQGYYFPGELLVIANGNTFNVKVTIDTDVATISSSTSIGYTKDSSSNDYQDVASRFVKHSKIDQVLRSPFFGPLKTSPLMTINGAQIKVYSHPSRIVNKSAITYIRKPQKIDVLLQRNCDLAEDFHQRIVDKAVEYAAGRLEQRPLVDIVTQENERNK